ncbi:MAG TPA: hypothetical protein VK716_13470 [Terracidiphilus sp.]|jgi:hypothetical protein|nr:hypothetical protein [Terracidiphilus sp.]
MRKFALICCVCLFALAMPRASRAQDAPKPNPAGTSAVSETRFYHLEFQVQELGADNKPVNSRTYTTTVSTDRDFRGSIRTGSRIPIATGSSAEGPSANVQFQYVDVGINFDLSHVVEIGHQISLDLSADVSSLAGARDPTLYQPVIRQNKWHAFVLVPVGKPSTVFTSDSLDSKGSMQVIMTATPIQ